MTSRRARWLSTDRSDGDFSPSRDRVALDHLCRSLVDAPWTLVDQVHGSDVLEVRSPGDRWGRPADALVTECSGAVLAVRTADCAAVVLVGRRDGGAVGPVGVAHAGWKGLAAGILQDTATGLRNMGAITVEWFLAPCISPREYEFGRSDLEGLVDRYGDSVASLTASGTPALDLAAGVSAAMAEVDGVPGGVIPRRTGADGGTGPRLPGHRTWHGPSPIPGPSVPVLRPLCTASNDQYYSWRSRRESGRQVTAVWLEDEKRPLSGRAVQRADGATN